MKKLGLVILLLVPLLSLEACKRAPLVNVESSPLGAPTGATLEQVTQAIEDAGKIEWWKLRLQEPGHFIGNLDVKGKHTAVVSITYDTRNFSIIYESSYNLNYGIERSVTYIHPNYLTWVGRLKSSIQRHAAAI